jgi:hypothetical protein
MKLCTHFTISGRTFPLSHSATTRKVDIVWPTLLNCSNYSVLLHAILIFVTLTDQGKYDSALWLLY